jgi:hypothetical protein
MQSHASRHVWSEFLSDLHPDLTAPFIKGAIPDEVANAYGRRTIPKVAVAQARTAHREETRAHLLNCPARSSWRS